MHTSPLHVATTRRPYSSPPDSPYIRPRPRRQQKRTVRATREQSEEVKTLLQLMGVPVVDAPCEAEASVGARHLELRWPARIAICRGTGVTSNHT